MIIFGFFFPFAYACILKFMTLNIPQTERLSQCTVTNDEGSSLFVCCKVSSISEC